jgi:hypothetical protein
MNRMTILLCATFTLTLLLDAALAQLAPSPDPGGSPLGDISNAITPGDPRFGSTIDVKGTPFVYEDWLDGTITLRDGKQFAFPRAFNVDALGAGGFLYLPSNGEPVDLTESLVRELQLVSASGSHVFRPVQSASLAGRNSGLWVVEVLHEIDAMGFYKRHAKAIRMTEGSSTYTIEPRSYQYITELEYYIRTGQDFTRIRLNKASIKAVSPQLAGKIKGAVSESSVIEAMKRI